MKKKQVLAVSSALMIGTTTALTGLPTPVMAQENTEVVQEAVVEENKTEQVPVEQKTENAEVQENITDKEQEETAENAETLKEESAKQETPATPEKEVVTEDKTVEASKNTEVKAGSIAIDETHFPDKVFREQIIAEFDKDGDSVLSVDEISKAQGILLPCERVCEISECAQIGTLEKGFDLEKMQRILNIEKVTEDECHKCWAYSECSGCIRFGNNCREDLKKLILKKCPEIKGNIENAFKDFTVLYEMGYDFDKLDC